MLLSLQIDCQTSSTLERTHNASPLEQWHTELHYWLLQHPENLQAQWDQNQGEHTSHCQHVQWHLTTPTTSHALNTRAACYEEPLCGCRAVIRLLQFVYTLKSLKYPSTKTSLSLQQRQEPLLSQTEAAQPNILLSHCNCSLPPARQPAGMTILAASQESRKHVHVSMGRLIVTKQMLPQAGGWLLHCGAPGCPAVHV